MMVNRHWSIGSLHSLSYDASMELHHGYLHIVIFYCRYCLKIFGFYFILYFWQPDSIRVMGDKSTARDTMKNAGVPTVPGSDGLLQVPHLIILVV